VLRVCFRLNDDREFDLRYSDRNARLDVRILKVKIDDHGTLPSHKELAAALGVLTPPKEYDP
jgi:hypothetical protein